MKHGYFKLGAESAPDTYRTRYSSDSPLIRIGCGQRRIGFGQRKFDRTRVRSTRGCGWDSSWIRFFQFFWIFPSAFGPGLQWRSSYLPRKRMLMELMQQLNLDV